MTTVATPTRCSSTSKVAWSSTTDLRPTSPRLTPDARVETVSIPVLAGTASGSSFTVELSGPTGGITGTGSAATVTIEGETAPGEGTPEDDATVLMAVSHK